MLESSLQAKFIKEVKLNKLGLAVKVDCSSRRGWPDVIFISTAGKTTYIEFKAVGGKLSVHQHDVHAELIDLGADVITLTGESGLNDFLILLAR